MRPSLRLEALDLSHLWGIFAFSLLVYCLGHSVMTQQPLFPALSLAWSVSHATGLTTIKVLLDEKKLWHKAYVFPFVVCLALVLSQALFSALTWLIEGAYYLHGYSSVVVYIFIGVTYWAFLRPRSEPKDGIWVDYGQQKAWLKPEDIILVRAAKNYVSIVSGQQTSEGIVRSSISEFAQTHSYLLRVHRSTLINPYRVISIKRLPRECLSLSLTDGHQVKVSSSYSDKVLSEIHSVPRADISSQSQ